MWLSTDPIRNKICIINTDINAYLTLFITKLWKYFNIVFIRNITIEKVKYQNNFCNYKILCTLIINWTHQLTFPLVIYSWKYSFCVIYLLLLHDMSSYLVASMLQHGKFVHGIYYYCVILLYSINESHFLSINVVFIYVSK